MLIAERDDFTRRLLLAVQRNANSDLRSIISKFILPIFPLSLLDKQGDPQMTAKSAILKVFKDMNEELADHPVSKQVLVLDAMLQLQQFPVGSSKNFLELAVMSLDGLAKMSAGYNTVHLIFDRY